MWDPDYWQQCGRELMQANAAGNWRADRRQWFLGDWLAAGDEHISQRKLWNQATKITGYPGGTLKNFLWMAKAFPPSRRRDKVSWSHHREVAKFPPEDQDKLLDAAVGRRDGRVIGVKSLKLFRAEAKRYAKGKREVAEMLDYSKGQRPFVDRENYQLEMKFGYVDTQAFNFLFATEKEVHGEKTVGGMLRWLVNRSLKDLGWNEKAKGFLKSAGIPHKP